nr:MobF family relaxase [Cellulomonas humilata]
MHRLTAGAGYRYLMKNIASGDCARTSATPLIAYYTESGNPPGRWLGTGLAGLGRADGNGVAPGIAAGTVVVEDALARLFAHGGDPLTGEPLGRPFPTVVHPAERIAARERELPESMDADARRSAIDTITRIELAKDSPRTIAGFDLTFTVMKSASALWALGDPRTQQAILDAHRAAVGQAMDMIETSALFTRTGHAGCRQERTRGVLAAAFDHWDSRAGDPNLHTHVVVSNKVQGLDGAWRSVDSRALHHAVVAVSETYEALFVDEMVRRLPVRWGWRDRGPRRSVAFELDGVEDPLLAEFSARSSQIDEAMTEVVAAFCASHGRTPNRIEVTRLRQQVTRATRPHKQVHPLGQLIESWRQRATTRFGHTPEALTAAALHDSQVRARTLAEITAPVREHIAAQVLVGVRERRSTWTRWNVLAEAARVTKGLVMATPDDRLGLLNAVADSVLDGCICLEAPRVFDSVGRYARPDGSSVFDRSRESRFTDQVILDAERRLLAAADDHDAPTALVLGDARAIRGPTKEPIDLSDDQLDAVRTVACSARRVDVVVGPAGAGKTTTLLGLRTTWERTHGQGSVIGIAPSSSAAATLAAALGINCENTAKWLHESAGAGAVHRGNMLTRLMARRTALAGPIQRATLRAVDTALTALTAQQRRWGLHPGQLVIIDEASLAGTLALDTLIGQVTDAGAKALLVGDHAQLSAVDAGGAFALLAERAGATHLRTLWRFSKPWEAASSAGLRLGDSRVLDTYIDQGRVHSGASEAMLEDAYTAWASDIDDGHAAILVAPDSRTVAALNERAHNDRVADGLVQAEGIATKSGVSVGTGDRIVTRANDRRLRADGDAPEHYVRNGDLWDVLSTRADGALVVRRSDYAIGTKAETRHDDGLTGTVVLPADYVDNHVDLGYATTTHRAQGITVEHAHVLAHAGMTRENLYVAMTRGRHENHVYVAVEDIAVDCDGLPDSHAALDAYDILRTVLATAGAELSATATIVARQDEALSLRRLEPIRRTLLADAAHARWTTALADAGLSAEQLRSVERSASAGQLFATLDRITLLTRDPAPVLRLLVSSAEASGPGLVDTLARSASSWLQLRAPDSRDVPPAGHGGGLGTEGLALLAEIDGLIAQRTKALTASALTDRPDWLARLGPEPEAPEARDAWIAQVGATAAHLDHLAPTSRVRGISPTPADSAALSI